MSGRSRLLLAVLLATAFLLAQGAAAQTAHTLTVSTNRSSYGPGDQIMITGKVSPPPGPSTGVFVQILNHAGKSVSVGEASVGASSGSYNLTVIAGGSSAWTVGEYTINATWGAYPPQIFATASFNYTTSPTTTTSSSSTTTSETSSTSSSTTSSTTSSSSTTTSSSTSSTTTTTTTSSKSGGGIPEFPYEGVLVGAIALTVVFAYMLVRRSALGLHGPQPESKR